ncbi:MAG: hypothetical protein Q8P56_04365 [Candidatus Uhrbacteria bacterium]|nr:hypothetical protein [Candidatus Uhrbacteria bacterium]
MKYFAAFVICVVVGALTAGILSIGSPDMQRKIRLDEQRVNDLALLQSQIVIYWQGKKTVPASLDLLDDPLLGFAAPRDPETEEPYSYTSTDMASFQLCADFNAESKRDDTSIPTKPRAPFPVGMMDQNWEHGAGRYCFDRTIDPDFFPPTKDITK